MEAEKENSASNNRKSSSSREKDTKSKTKKITKWREYKNKLVPDRLTKMVLPLKTDILHLMKGNFPEANISDTGMDVLADLIVDLATKVVSEADNLRQLASKPAEFISQRDMESAFRLMFHGDFLSIMQARASCVSDLSKQNEKATKSNNQSE